MISEDEVKQLSIQLGVPLHYVEKDYVMGWLLWGIYNHPLLARNLILKGGNCLRKVYFPDTRFSDDLDFTAMRLDAEKEFHRHLDSLCQTVGARSGIEFDFSRTRVEEKHLADGESKAIAARVYFKGFAGDSSLTMRIKFDVSEFEKIVFPVQYHPLIHQFSDAQDCAVDIHTYSLEEVLAEKLRSWIQRTRARDLFDLAKIISSQAIPISRSNILRAFFQKTIFKQIPAAGRDELLYESKFSAIERQWLEAIICPPSTSIIASNAIALFTDFVEALFSPEALEILGVSREGSTAQYAYDIRSGVRETIIEAGKARKLIQMRYNGRERTVEPYSFRFRVTKKGYGTEYFYGYDRTRGQTIKSFFLHQIQGVSVLPNEFIPRWVVEF
jgi:predicted nucleotidyltransferase component of viral defense system